MICKVEVTWRMSQRHVTSTLQIMCHNYFFNFTSNNFAIIPIPPSLRETTTSDTSVSYRKPTEGYVPILKFISVLLSNLASLSSLFWFYSSLCCLVLSQCSHQFSYRLQFSVEKSSIEPILCYPSRTKQPTDQVTNYLVSKMEHLAAKELTGVGQNRTNRRILDHKWMISLLHVSWSLEANKPYISTS